MKYWFLVLSFVSLSAWSHPVVYKDGIVWDQMITPRFSNISTHYSFRYDWSIGLNGLRFENQNEETREYGFFKINHLLKRWNNKDSQGNIYLHSGIGTSRDDFAFIYGAEADWESRRLFTMAKYLHVADQLVDQNLYMARVGISPVLADVDQLQVWFMIQGMYESYISRTVKITPMLRFFYHNVLWELGSSLDGDHMLAFMVHY